MAKSKINYNDKNKALRNKLKKKSKNSKQTGIKKRYIRHGTRTYEGYFIKNKKTGKTNFAEFDA